MNEALKIAQVKQREASIKDLQKEAKTLLADLVKLQERRVEMETEMDSNKEKHEKEVAELKSKNNDLEVEVLMLQEKYETFSR